MAAPVKFLIAAVIAASAGGNPAVSPNSRIQSELDAHPGQMVFVPPGAHHIHEPIRVTTDGGGLWGPGRIVQTNPNEPIIHVENAARVRLSGLSLQRPAEGGPAEQPGLLVVNGRDVVIDGVSVHDNQAKRGAIEVRASRHVTVRGCTVWNYKRIAVDDRTDSDLYGYAFHCIDGHGILVERSQHVHVLDNRVVEERWLPTRENAERYSLGRLTEGKRPAALGELGVRTVRENQVNNWHQGSAIFVGGPKESMHVRVAGNAIENAAQGIDLHADLVTVAENTIDHGLIGIKLTHGSRGAVITGNTLSHIDLWGILLMPGAGSHAGNRDGDAIIANNHISAFGFGHEYWNWGGRHDDRGSSYCIALQEGQLAENPPLRGVIVQGNIVSAGEGGDSEPPRHRFALYIAPPGGDDPARPRGPENVLVSGNQFAPGAQGVSNAALP